MFPGSLPLVFTLAEALEDREAGFLGVGDGQRLEFGGHDKLDIAIQRRSQINKPSHPKRLKQSYSTEDLNTDFDMLQALGQDSNEMDQI